MVHSWLLLRFGFVFCVVVDVMFLFIFLVLFSLLLKSGCAYAGGPSETRHLVSRVGGGR